MNKIPLCALIVDDEPDLRELLDITLTRMGLLCIVAGSLAEARSELEKRVFSLCITDMNLPDGNGMDLIALIQQDYPQTPVAMLTAYGSMETAINALKAGAFDFVSKPLDLGKLRELVQHALRAATPLLAEPTAGSDGSPLLGASESMRKLRGNIQKLARSQAPVYISGESGAGKELVARQIHACGPRAAAPFIPVNCGAIPAELMESEFFGHKRGSFTGAFEDKAGLFQAAGGGTLFLDEIADLPMHMQVKLLRALQEKAVRPVGAAKEISTDVRILTATHRPLADLVDSGHFRQDLYYRINVIQLHVPPLRERREDIPVLTETFLRQLATKWNIETPRLSRMAMESLAAHPFPGNVRELENILERAMTLCEGQVIEADHLQLQTLANDRRQGPAAETLPAFEHAGESLEDYLSDIERSAILKALEDTRWNRTAAARKLGMSFRSLRYRLKKLGLESDDDIQS